MPVVESKDYEPDLDALFGPRLTRSQALHRRTRKKKYTKYKGVCWHKNRKHWVATIRYGGRKIHLGVFKTELEASRAYDAAARKIYGDFAIINLPNP